MPDRNGALEKALKCRGEQVFKVLDRQTLWDLDMARALTDLDDAVDRLSFWFLPESSGEIARRNVRRVLADLFGVVAMNPDAVARYERLMSDPPEIIEGDEL